MGRNITSRQPSLGNTKKVKTGSLVQTMTDYTILPEQRKLSCAGKASWNTLTMESRKRAS